MCVVLWEGRCAHFGAGMEIREQLQELLLSYLLGPRDETQVSRLSASPTESSEKLVFPPTVFVQILTSLSTDSSCLVVVVCFLLITSSLRLPIRALNCF